MDPAHPDVLDLKVDHLRRESQWWQSFRPLYVFVRAEKNSVVAVSYSSQKKKLRTLPIARLYSDTLVPNKEVIYQIMVSQLEPNQNFYVELLVKQGFINEMDIKLVPRDNVHSFQIKREEADKPAFYQLSASGVKFQQYRVFYDMIKEYNTIELRVMPKTKSDMNVTLSVQSSGEVLVPHDTGLIIYRESNITTLVDSPVLGIHLVNCIGKMYLLPSQQGHSLGSSDQSTDDTIYVFPEEGTLSL